MASESIPVIGEHIEHYRILAHVGDGGMGTVFRAIDTMLEREVALKVLRTDLSNQGDVTKRFRAEAVTLARLSHPHIATLFGLVRHGSQLCMVMEYVPGETLATLMHRETRLSWERAVRIAVPILSALDYAHGAGIIHRDIKPSNVVVSPTGVVKVLDFGIARVLNADRMTRQGFILGTPQYMAPEQIRAIDLDGRADVYSVGVLLYEMLAGHLPFRADNDIALMYAHLEGQILPLAEAAPSTPPWLFDVVGRALARKPDERFASAAAFRDALAARVGLRDAGSATVAAPVIDLDAPTIVPQVADPCPVPPQPTPAQRPQQGLGRALARLGRVKAWLPPRVTWEYYAGPDGMLTVRRTLRPRSGVRARLAAVPDAAPTSPFVTPHDITMTSAERMNAGSDPRWFLLPMRVGVVALAVIAAAMWLRRVERLERPSPGPRMAQGASSSIPPRVASPPPPAPAASPSAAHQGAALSEPVEAGGAARDRRPAAPGSSARPSRIVVPSAVDRPAERPGGADKPRRDGPTGPPSAIAAPAPTPSEAAAPPARTPPPNLRNEAFEGVSLLVPGKGGGFDEQEVTITFERDRLTVFDTDEDRIVATILYVGDGTSSSVTGAATLLVGSERWFVVPTSTGRIVLQLDEDTAGRVAAAFETRTGLPVTRSRGELGR